MHCQRTRTMEHYKKGETYVVTFMLVIYRSLLSCMAMHFLKCISISFLYALLASITSLSTCNNHVVHVAVNNLTGNNSLCKHDTNVRCKSLEPISMYISGEGKQNVIVTIETDATLSGLMDVKSSRNVTIRSKNIHTQRTIFCNINSGMKFENITQFEFLNLKVSNCGWQYNGSLYHYRAAMLFHFSSGLKFQNVVFSHNVYTALVLLDCRKDAEFHKVNFSKNGAQSKKLKHDKYSYAAGVSIAISTTDNSNYSFVECYFIDNVSPNNTRASKQTALTWSKFRGLGGALSIIMENKVERNYVLIESSKFYGNQAKWGAGIYADYRNNARNNTICIHSTVFKGNRAGKGGGGANMGYLTSHCNNNMITISNCQFNSNGALFGGGLAVFSYYFKKNCKRSVIKVTNSSWSRNTGNLGAAVDLTPIDPFQSQRGFLPNPMFNNCTFVENKLQNTFKTSLSKPVNSGVFIATRFIVTFQMEVNFTQNQFTALYVLSGSVKFLPSTNATFHGNIGYSGGAIALYSFSTIVVGECAHLNFTNNHAYTRGGGIYYQTMDQHNFMAMSKNCFIRTEQHVNMSKKAVFTFRGNTAESGGKSIYSDSFKAVPPILLSTRK